MPALAWSLIPAAVALLVYLLQVPAASGDKDGSEFTLVLATGGVAHPTGYPVYLLLGHGFVTLLRGFGAGWAWAANAWSAVGGAVAVLFLHALAVALIPAGARLGARARLLAGLLPVALFGLNPIWTYEAVLAEVYSWHVAWVMAACWYFVWLARRLGSEREPWTTARGRAHAVGWGLLCGLGGAHHLTAFFVAAPLSLTILWIGRSRRRVGIREAALVVAAAVVPLVSYGFVAWRAFHPAAWQWPTLVASWSGVFEHVTGAAYRNYLGFFQPEAEQRPFLLRYVYPFLFAGLGVLVAAAAVARHRGQRSILVGLAAAALLGTGYAFNYGVPDPASYFLGPMAIGIVSIVPLGVALAERGRWRRAAMAGCVVAALFAAAFGWHGLRLGQARKRVFLQFERRVHGMWESIPFERGFVLWESDMYARLLDYQVLRGEKVELDVINPRVLMNPIVLERFVARHGFDPVQGVALPPDTFDARRTGRSDELLQRIARSLNERSPLPVVLFDPERESVRLMRKP